LRLRQVLVNLLGNAVKYNRRGGSVTINWQLSANGNQVRLEVADTGRGLSPQQLAHLFEPFNRLGADASAIEGTGIGLVISQRLVQSMGGELEVSSEAGVGSCFRVVLPVALHEPSSVLTDAGVSMATVPGALGPRTVLYADDNALNVEVVLAVLRAARPDVRVVVARNGAEAIASARAEGPDLMLLDMHLGDMTGLEVMAALSLDPALADLPCVALSADAMPAAVERAERAGFKAYLTKPLNVKLFLQCIDKLLIEQ
jgi:CheY-like chemotaxis protein/anti-sigma regulatory factor (Ser/Thr protein kinase)